MNLIVKKKQKIILAVSVCLLLLLVIGVSYAYIAYYTRQKGVNRVETGCLQMEMEELTSAMKLENAYPISDESGKNTKPFRFRITNTCTMAIDYNINLEVLGIKNGSTIATIPSSDIAVMVDSNTKTVLNTNPTANKTYKESDYEATESYTVGKGSIVPDETKTHQVRVWVDQSAGNESQGKEFYSKVVIEGMQGTTKLAYREEILNGADPVLSGDLIPVRIADDGVVTKANIETEWYNYTNKEWANAVILLDKSITYNNNDVIPESNIESYFVWIPRYKYKIWDEGKYDSLTGVLTADKLGMAESKAHTIQIEFEDKDVAASTGSTIDSWLTHPAFTAFGVNGLWVGKFETGYKNQSTMNPGEAITNVNDSSKVQIKPNVYSWREIQVSNAHLTSYNYQRELDSHMMKNTEWGAVAYLQHSAYGSQTSVKINNNSSYLTGYAAINEPTCGFTGKNESCNKYGTTEDITVGYFSTNTDSTGNKIVNLTSTTGNKTGVFDMSGGAWEYVMGVMVDQAGNPASGRHNVYNSGFNGTLTCPTCTDSGVTVDKTTTSVTGKTPFPDAKYYDKYAYGTSNQNYKFRILGDATGEMGPFAGATYGTQNRQIGSWYNDETWFVDSSIPWFNRGGRFVGGLGAGVFAFGTVDGGAGGGGSFRVVLAP